jgi:hypothetical protein
MVHPANGLKSKVVKKAIIVPAAAIHPGPPMCPAQYFGAGVADSRAASFAGLLRSYKFSPPEPSCPKWDGINSACPLPRQAITVSDPLRLI